MDGRCCVTLLCITSTSMLLSMSTAKLTICIIPVGKFPETVDCCWSEREYHWWRTLSCVPMFSCVRKPCQSELTAPGRRHISCCGHIEAAEISIVSDLPISGDHPHNSCYLAHKPFVVQPSRPISSRRTQSGLETSSVIRQLLNATIDYSTQRVAYGDGDRSTAPIPLSRPI